MFVVDGYLWIEGISEMAGMLGDNSTAELLHSHVSWERYSDSGPEAVTFLALKTDGGQQCLPSSFPPSPYFFLCFNHVA